MIFPNFNPLTAEGEARKALRMFFGDKPPHVQDMDVPEAIKTIGVYVGKLELQNRELHIDHAEFTEAKRRNAQLEAALANQQRVLQHAALLLELASNTWATHAQRNGMNMLISEYLKRFQHSRNDSVIPPVEMVDDIPF